MVWMRVDIGIYAYPCDFIKKKFYNIFDPTELEVIFFWKKRSSLHDSELWSRYKFTFSKTPWRHRHAIMSAPLHLPFDCLSCQHPFDGAAHSPILLFPCLHNVCASVCLNFLLPPTMWNWRLGISAVYYPSQCLASPSLACPKCQTTATAAEPNFAVLDRLAISCDVCSQPSTV